MSTEIDENKEVEQTETFVEGKDYYFEHGMMVLTARFLMNRGYCCNNGCRHCPYPPENSVQSK